MPELPEVEAYRRLVEGRALGRVVASLDAGDPWYLKGGLEETTLRSALVGRSLRRARRRGKLLLVDTGAALPGPGVGPVLGLRFGMTGQLLVDGITALDRLLYAPAALAARYERLVVHFADGGRLVVSDPRRLGGVHLDPDEEALGPDALAVGPGDLRAALRSARAVKAVLLDQSKVAGIGNLVADEVLWRAGVAPGQPADSLTPARVRRLHAAIASTLADLIERGGAHTGDLMAERHPGGHCPTDGALLRRGVVGGRTSWWCPSHQR